MYEVGSRLRGGTSPVHCEVSEICGTSQFHSVGGSSDAVVRCQYCSSLFVTPVCVLVLSGRVDGISAAR